MIHYEMPKETRKYVLQLQAALKIKTGNGKFSQQQTLNWIIKDHKENNIISPTNRKMQELAKELGI